MLYNRIIQSVTLVIAFLAISQSVAGFANQPEVVDSLYYAGFALAGSAADSEENYPITSKLLQDKEDNGIPRIEALLWQNLSSTDNAHLLRQDLVDATIGTNAVAVAFVLDWENIAHEPIQETTKVVVDLHGQILVFDFDTKKIIASYPVAVQLIDVVAGTVTPEHEHHLIENLFYAELGKGVLGSFAEKFSDLQIKRSYGNYMGVVNVELEEKALATLEEYQEDTITYSNSVADNFGKRLSTNLGIPFVPYSKGSAIGSKMVARFADGTVYQFEIPSPDYRIHITVRGFKKVPLDSNNAVTAWAYGSYLRVKITDFDDAEIYLDAPFKYGAVKKILNGNENLDDWTIYQESMFSLIDQLTHQLGNPDRKWLSEWSNGRETQKQIENLETIIARSK